MRHALREYKKQRERTKVAKKQATQDDDDGKDILVSVNGGPDNVLLLDGSSSAVASGGLGPLSEKAQDALRTLFSNITSGHTLQHTLTVVETKLIPMLLSDSCLVKPPKQSRVSLPLVFRRLVEIWDPALQFLAHKWRTQQNLPFYGLLLKCMIGRLSGPSSSRSPSQVDWPKDLVREWAVHILKTQAAHIFKEERTTTKENDNSAATPGKKRTHAAMSDAASSSSASSTPLIDELMYRCLKSLNVWLAPLVPLLLPCFKHAHSGACGVSAVGLSNLDLLVHLTTSRLYPDQRTPKPNNININTNSDNTHAEDTKKAMQEFIQAHKKQALSAVIAGESASSSSSAVLGRMADFPVMPIGMANQEQQSLWLENEGHPNT